MPPLTDTDARTIADALYQALNTRTPIAPLTATRPTLSLTEAYLIQSHFMQRRIDDGETLRGYKLGITSKPMQDLLGVDHPDFGPIFASAVLESGTEVQSDAFIAPRAEAEIAVILQSDLTGPNCTALDARRASAGIAASIEVVDSRIADWKIGLADTIADLASSGVLILSSTTVPIDGFDPRLVGMAFSRGGEVVATGAGAAALGDPFAAVAWLANTLGSLGVTLRAGQIIMTGALHAMVPMAPGDVFTAEFDRLGSVTLRVA